MKNHLKKGMEYGKVYNTICIFRKADLMKIWNLIKKILKSTCVYFTLISLLFLLLSLADSKGASGGFNFSALFFLPFGLAMALGQELICVKKLSAGIRYLSHYAITLLAIFCFLFLPSGNMPSGSTMLILFALLTVLYWIAFGIVALMRRRIKKLMEED